MTAGYLIVALAYAGLGVAVWWFEARRVRSSGPDPTLAFMLLFLLQCCIAGIGIFATLPFADPAAPTGVESFDRIFQATDFTTALLVLTLTLWFVIVFYISCAVGRFALRGRSPAGIEAAMLEMHISRGRLLCLLLGGAVLTLVAYYSLGDSIASRYTNLILLRSNYEGIERTILNSDALSLIQTWAWLSLVALFCALDRNRRGPVWIVYLILGLMFALLGVSRRALFLPIVIGYLALLLYDGRWRLRWLMVCAVPIVLLVAFGEEILGVLAYGGNAESVTGEYTSWVGAVLRGSSEIGITNVESLGTVSLLHLNLRYGVDHLLSVAQRFPEGILGLDFNFPERIVRVSTATFADADSADIPPGLFGQMWIDFGVLGPVVWGVMFGLQMSIVQHLFERTRRTKPSSAVFAVIVFVVALPLNTGSLDFTFSIDIIVLVFALLWCVRLRSRPRARMPDDVPPVLSH
jgi:hypothetical protein